jgi:hypothetical protein
MEDDARISGECSTTHQRKRRRDGNCIHICLHFHKHTHTHTLTHPHFLSPEGRVWAFRLPRCAALCAAWTRGGLAPTANAKNRVKKGSAPASGFCLRPCLLPAPQPAAVRRRRGPSLCLRLLPRRGRRLPPGCHWRHVHSCASNCRRCIAHYSRRHVVNNSRYDFGHVVNNGRYDFGTL